MFGKKMQLGNEDGQMPTLEERGLAPGADDERFPSVCLPIDEASK
jgi:hypothetical protein